MEPNGAIIKAQQLFRHLRAELFFGWPLPGFFLWQERLFVPEFFFTLEALSNRLLKLPDAATNDDIVADVLGILVHCQTVHRVGWGR